MHAHIKLVSKSKKIRILRSGFLKLIKLLTLIHLNSPRKRGTISSCLLQTLSLKCSAYSCQLPHMNLQGCWWLRFPRPRLNLSTVMSAHSQDRSMCIESLGSLLTYLDKTPEFSKCIRKGLQF